MTEEQKIVTFGAHLTIDGYGGSVEKLNDSALLLKCLNELPEMIDMKKLAEPVVYKAEGGNPKDSGGYSGFVVIETSHISCHTFPFRRFVSIDVYTCQNEINKEFVEKYFKDAFELQDLEINYLKRGTRFPADDIA